MLIATQEYFSTFSYYRVQPRVTATKVKLAVAMSSGGTCAWVSVCVFCGLFGVVFV